MLIKKLFLLSFIYTSLTYYNIAQNKYWEIFAADDMGNNASAIICITEDKNNNIWVGTIGEGIFKYDWNGWANYNTDNSPLPTNRITSIAVDSSNVKWIGTFGNIGGLTKYDENNWKVFNLEDYGIEGNTTYDIKIDEIGTFWMGSYWQGLIEFDGDTTFTQYNSSNTNLSEIFEEIISINVKLDSMVLCGSEAAGAAEFYKNDTTWTEYHYGIYPIDEVINSIEIDDNNNIWFAGIDIVSMVDTSLNWFTFNYGAKSYYADILINKDNTVLFSTINDGLLKLDYLNNEEWTKIIPSDPILEIVGCDGLMKDHNGNIWIGYNNGYLALYNPDGITGVQKTKNTIPTDYYLFQNFPNPFNPTTQISYQIPKDGFVKLIVYNALGQKITKLVNEHQTIGKYSVQFNANNLPSGLYFYRLQSGNFSDTKKLILLK